MKTKTLYNIIWRTSKFSIKIEKEIDINKDHFYSFWKSVANYDLCTHNKM